MFIIGVFPALMTFWIRRSIPESARWERVNAGRRSAVERKRGGAVLGVEELALTRITLVDLMADREIRRLVAFTFLMSLATTVAYWGIGAWIPPTSARQPPRSGSTPNSGRVMQAWRIRELR